MFLMCFTIVLCRFLGRRTKRRFIAFIEKTAKQSDARVKSYGQGSGLLNWLACPKSGAPAPQSGREFRPVLTVFDPFEGPIAGEVKERLRGLKT